MNLYNYFELAKKGSDHLPNKYIAHAEAIANAKSTCARKAVGAVIVDSNGTIIGEGWNGTPEKSYEKKWNSKINNYTIISDKETCKSKYESLAQINISPNDPFGKDILHLYIMQNEIHAEDRSIQNCLYKNKIELKEKCLENFTIYTTLSPCTNCANMINWFGLTLGGWKSNYNRDTSGLGLIKKIFLKLKKSENLQQGLE